MSDESSPQESAKESLQRIQAYDTSTLSRKGELGQLNFDEAIPYAERLVSLYRKLTLSIIEEVPDDLANNIKGLADADYQLFTEIEEFDVTAIDNPANQRQNIINRISARYREIFKQLYPLVGYSIYNTVDFDALDAQARSTLQEIRDRAATLEEDLQSQKEEAEAVLKQVRQAAAEQGVSQQAAYFRDEAARHETASSWWGWWVFGLSLLLVVYAASTLFVHRIPVLSPTTLYDVIALTASKILVFAVLGYGLVIVVRNYISNKHNEVVNRHRQNALMSYRALVDAAAQDSQAGEAVLIHAAACIYSPQATGYTRGEIGEQAGASSVVELLSRPASRSGSSEGG